MFNQIAAAVTASLKNVAESFPDDTTAPVTALCDGKSLRVLQDLMAEVEQLETALWDRLWQEDRISALQPWTWARPFLSSGQKQLIFEAGEAGFTHLTRFAGFHVNLSRLVDTITNIHELNNAVLQRLPWSNLPSS